MGKSVTDRLTDFIEWEFNVEITPKLESGIGILAALIKTTKEKKEEVEEETLDEDEDFWRSAYSSKEKTVEELFDSPDEDEDFDDED
jgi:hypothetical protein